MPNRKRVLRWILYSLGLLGVNFLVTFAAMLAFFLFLFRDASILAVVPAALALPAIALQPWFLVFFFVPRGIIIAPLLTTVFTVFVYGWLDSHGRLERPKQFLLKFKPRRIVAVAAGVVLLAIAFVVARYVDLPAHHGTPPSIRVDDLTITESRYYCLGEFIDSAWLWQARVSETELARLSEHYGLSPIDGGKLPEKFTSMPPYWWHPLVTERTRVLSTPNFPLDERGPDGWHALASWNPDDEVLHVWIKDNF